MSTAVTHESCTLLVVVQLAGARELQPYTCRMKRESGDEFIDKLVARDLAGTQSEFTEADIDFARQNPHVLQKLADPLEVKKRYIYVLFGTAVVLAVISKVLEYTGVLAEEPIANDIFTNVMFSVSIELFGAATVAFIMELVFEQRVKRNRMLVEALAREASEPRES